MSRLYEMEIRIYGVNSERIVAIKEAVKEEWGFDYWYQNTDPISKMIVLHSYAEDYLCGGKSEADFATNVSIAVWKANGSFCEVVIEATCKEYIPSESYTHDEYDYEKLMNKL